MTGYWEYRTRHGTFRIVPILIGEDTRYDVRFGDESLGNYHSATSALDDLVGGHTCWPSNGLDPSEVGLAALRMEFFQSAHGS